MNVPFPLSLSFGGKIKLAVYAALSTIPIGKHITTPRQSQPSDLQYLLKSIHRKKTGLNSSNTWIYV